MQWPIGGSGALDALLTPAPKKSRQEFDVATPSPGAAHGHRGFSARQQYTGRSDGLTPFGNLQRNAGKHLPHVARLALEGIAENVGIDARGCRRCLECQIVTVDMISREYI